MNKENTIQLRSKLEPLGLASKIETLKAGDDVAKFERTAITRAPDMAKAIREQAATIELLKCCGNCVFFNRITLIASGNGCEHKKTRKSRAVWDKCRFWVQREK